MKSIVKAASDYIKVRRVTAIIKEPRVIEEKLSAGDYEVYKEVQSKIDPRKTYRVLSHTECPHCRNAIPELVHGVMAVCCSCNLVMTRRGNALDCQLTE